MVDESNYRVPGTEGSNLAPYGNNYDNRPLPTKGGGKNPPKRGGHQPPKKAVSNPMSYGGPGDFSDPADHLAYMADKFGAPP